MAIFYQAASDTPTLVSCAALRQGNPNLSQPSPNQHGPFRDGKLRTPQSERMTALRVQVHLRRKGLCMKDAYEVSRLKESEISRVGVEVEALRVVAPLLSDDEKTDSNSPAPGGSTVSLQPVQVPEALNSNPQPDHSPDMEKQGQGLVVGILRADAAAKS
jgi:hypothetical protein